MTIHNMLKNGWKWVHLYTGLQQSVGKFDIPVKNAYILVHTVRQETLIYLNQKLFKQQTNVVSTLQGFNVLLLPYVRQSYNLSDVSRK